jgi:hypothetical protein
MDGLTPLTGGRPMDESHPALTNLLNQALERVLEERRFQLPLSVTLLGTNGVLIMATDEDVGEP